MESKTDKAEKPEMLFQYRPPQAWAFGNLYRRVLYFNSPLNFNDPHDFRYPPSLRNMTDEHFAFFKEVFDYDKEARYRKGESKDEFAARVNKILAGNFAEFREKVGIACFSRFNNNLAMWSHYGGRGEGFCLAFNTQTDGLFGGTNLAEMQYQNNLPNATDAIRDYDKNRSSFHYSIVHKSMEWEYEKEWRLSKTTQTKHPKEREVHYDPEALSAIYLGTNATENTMDIISAIRKEEYPHAELLKARLNEGKYELEFDLL